MNQETEVKFLVTNDSWRENVSYSVEIVQGYLNQTRIRVQGNKGFITIKVKVSTITRKEYEYEIPKMDAINLLELCGDKIIHKRRNLVSHKGSNWEIDEFFYPTSGLVMAELEIPNELHSYARPQWLGKEVTNDPEYYNEHLVNK